MTPMVPRRRCGAALAGLALAAALAFPLHAQEPAASLRAGSASPRLGPEHWAVHAARRAEALGLAPGFLPAERTASRSTVEAALREAATRAPAQRPEAAALAAEWHRRFVEEFPEYRPDRRHNDAPIVPLGGRVGGGAERVEGRLSPGSRLTSLRVAPAPLADETGLVYRSTIALGFGRWMSATAEQYAHGTELEIPRWEVAVAAGAWNVSAGAEPVGYGTGRGGGVVLTGTQSVTRLAVETRRPLPLPGPLGRATVHAFAAPVTDSRHPGDPWLWGARLAVQPHARLVVALNRAAVFGGSAVAEADGGRIAGLLGFGRQTDFRNEVTSFDARWRIPAGAALPLVAYAEWGVDDAAQRWTQAPGVVAGLWLAAVPGLPEASAGVEHATFRGRCCDISPWYFDVTQGGGWVLDDEPLGHPLGGEGRETSAYARADLWGARLRLDGRAFVRRREAYAAGTHTGNLYAPLHAGDSAGGEVEAALRVLGRGEVRLRWSRDAGDGWRHEAVAADLAFLF